jgi:hypothetical protein
MQNIAVEHNQIRNKAVIEVGFIEKLLHGKIGLTNYLLLCYFLALYIMPYFRTMFNIPAWIATREVLFAILAVFLIGKRSKMYIPLYMYFYIMLIFTSFIISENKSVAFVTFRILVQFVGVYIFSKAFIKNESQVKLFCKFFYCVGLITILIIIMQTIVGPVPALNMHSEYDDEANMIAGMRFGLVRLATIFGNPITSGMLGLMFLVQVFTVNKRLILKMLLISCTCLGIVLTISKAPILLMLVILMYYSWKRIFNLGLVSKVVLLTIATCLLIPACLRIVSLPQSISTEYLDTLKYMNNVSLDEQFNSDIETRFFEKPKLGIEMMRNISPLTFLVGAGYDIAGQAGAEMGIGIKPHNALLEIFMNLGLLGVMLYSYIFVLLIRFAIMIKPITKLDLHIKGLSLGLIATLLSSLVVDPHVTHVLMVPTFFLLAIRNSYNTIVVNRAYAN